MLILSFFTFLELLGACLFLSLSLSVLLCLCHHSMVLTELIALYLSPRVT